MTETSWVNFVILYKPNPLIIALFSFLFLVSGQTVFADSQKKFERLLHIDLFGDDITERGFKGVSVPECENLCSSNNECVAYTYIVSKSWCFLKNGEGQPQHKPDVISGVSSATAASNAIQKKGASDQYGLPKIYSEVLASVSKTNRNSVARIIESYVNECEGYSGTAPLKVSSEDIVELKLKGGTTVTVVMAGFECPVSEGPSFPWSGSAGSPTYYVVGDVIYEGPRAYPSTVDFGDMTLIINWHGGIYCKRGEKEFLSNIDTCLSVMFWHDYYKDFISFDGEFKLIERDF